MASSMSHWACPVNNCHLPPKDSVAVIATLVAPQPSLWSLVQHPRGSGKWSFLGQAMIAMVRSMELPWIFSMTG